MKSLPRPWYLTKWRKPASRRSRNDVGAVETFCGAWVLMEEEAADAEMRNLGHSPAILFLGKLNWIVDDEEEDPVRMSELRRRLGEVRGTEIVAAMAMDLTSTVPTTLYYFSSSLSLPFSQGKATLLVVILREIAQSAVDISVSRFEKNGFNGF